MSAASEIWRALTGIEVTWDFRSLSDFNDRSLVELAEDYDLLIVDHPAVAAAVEGGALIAYDELLEPARLDAIVAGGIGPSALSYRYRNHTWALAVDAACQVSAFNPRMLAAPPSTWRAVQELAASQPRRVALPLSPADAICSALSLAATLGEPVTRPGELPLVALRALSELAPLVHDESWTSSPPQLLAAMAAREEIAFVPLTFGYRALAGQRVHFADAPLGDGGRAPVLGGAGIAVSARSIDPPLAAAFSAWLCEPDPQRTVVFAHGGQPAHVAVWDAADEPFFSDTRRSIEQAYVRPAYPEWHAWQRRAGQALHAGLRSHETPQGIAEHLREAGVPA